MLVGTATLARPALAAFFLYFAITAIVPVYSEADNMTSFHVPPVIIGCWQLLERDRDPAHAIATLRAYFDANFTTFDTADIYGPSESLLGEFRKQLPPERREHVQIFTKFVTQEADSAAQVNRNSRKNLAYERATGDPLPLDLVQFHWWDFSDQAGYLKAGENLKTLQKEALIRQIGVTNFDVGHLRKLLEPPVLLPVRVNQVQYSLLDRRPENGMLALAREYNFQLACFGSVAGGWLSDRFLGADTESKVQKEIQKTGNTISLRMYRSSLESWAVAADGRSIRWDLFQELLQTLRRIANTKSETVNESVTIANIASEWVLEKLRRDGAGGGLIIGVRDTKHIEETTRFVKWHKEGSLQLEESEMEQIEAVSKKGRWPKGEDIWSRERG